MLIAIFRSAARISSTRCKLLQFSRLIRISKSFKNSAISSSLAVLIFERLYFYSVLIPWNFFFSKRVSTSMTCVTQAVNIAIRLLFFSILEMKRGYSRDLRSFLIFYTSVPCFIQSFETVFLSSNLLIIPDSIS